MRQRKSWLIDISGTILALLVKNYNKVVTQIDFRCATCRAPDRDPGLTRLDLPPARDPAPAPDPAPAHDTLHHCNTLTHHDGSQASCLGGIGLGTDPGRQRHCRATHIWVSRWEGSSLLQARPRQHRVTVCSAARPRAKYGSARILQRCAHHKPIRLSRAANLIGVRLSTGHYGFHGAKVQHVLQADSMILVFAATIRRHDQHLMDESDMLTQMAALFIDGGPAKLCAPIL